MNDDMAQVYATLQLLDDKKSESLLSETYLRFFKVCPEAESLWEKDDPASRGKMFNSVILTIMDNMARPEISEKNLQSDVKEHNDYGVSKEMYSLFFCSLIEALNETLGENFNQDMEQAWKRQFDQIEGQVDKHTSIS